MKTEKLNLLLNKVVEFHKPNSIYCKGFLYKDRSGFYIKVVEDAGAIQTKDIIRLEDGDEQFITQAEKPKLMRISLKSWHYRLIKFVLGDNAPTPKTMQNGCPYFWLLILSIFVAPFKLIGVGIREFVFLFPKMFDRFIEYSVENWTQEIDDKYAFDLYRNHFYVDKKIPMTSRIYMRKKNYGTKIYREEFLQTYIQKKYGIAPHTDEYFDICKKIEKEWKIWDNEQDKIKREVRRERELIEHEKRKIALRKKAEWEKKISPIQNQIDKIFNSIVKVFTIKKDWSSLIRRTKQVVGGIVTVLLLFLVYIFTTMLSHLIMFLGDVIINNWIIFVFVLALAAVVGILWLLYWVIAIWVQSLIDKYRRGKKVWYVEAPIYGIYMPLKYLVLGIAFLVLWILWKPTHFVGYKILWLPLLFPVGKWIWKGLKGLWNAVLGSTGIFGEYFSASYTDYCPGIEWADTEEE